MLRERSRNRKKTEGAPDPGSLHFFTLLSLPGVPLGVREGRTQGSKACWGGIGCGGMFPERLSGFSCWLECGTNTLSPPKEDALILPARPPGCFAGSWMWGNGSIVEEDALSQGGIALRVHSPGMAPGTDICWIQDP